MTQRDFIQQLEQALAGELGHGVVKENIDYYEQYIEGEVKKGKAEEDVVSSLGDPWVIAKTVIQAQGSQDEFGSNYRGNVEQYSWGDEREASGSPYVKVHHFGLGSWRRILAVVLVVALVVVMTGVLLVGVIYILLPILIPILILYIVYRLLRSRS